MFHCTHRLNIHIFNGLSKCVFLIVLFSGNKAISKPKTHSSPSQWINIRSRTSLCIGQLVPSNSKMERRCLRTAPNTFEPFHPQDDRPFSVQVEPYLSVSESELDHTALYRRSFSRVDRGDYLCRWIPTNPLT